MFANVVAIAVVIVGKLVAHIVVVLEVVDREQATARLPQWALHQPSVLVADERARLDRLKVADRRVEYAAAQPLTREDGTEREVLIVTDERAGAAASAECPGGGLHLYDITGDKEKDPQKIGTWFIPAVQPQGGQFFGRPPPCTNFAPSLRPFSM